MPKNMRYTICRLKNRIIIETKIVAIVGRNQVLLECEGEWIVKERDELMREEDMSLTDWQYVGTVE